MKVLSPAALEHYRVAAMVGQKLGAIRTHTVHVKPDDLAALVDRYTDGLVDEVKIAIAGQCSCHEAGCLHDRIRAAAGDVTELREQLALANRAIDEYLPHPNGEKQLSGNPDAWNAAMFNLGKLREQLEEATKLPHPAGALARARVRAWSMSRDLGMVRKIIALARSLGPENVSVAELLDQIEAAVADPKTESAPTTVPAGNSCCRHAGTHREDGFEYCNTCGQLQVEVTRAR